MVGMTATRSSGGWQWFRWQEQSDKTSVEERPIPCCIVQNVCVCSDGVPIFSTKRLHCPADNERITKYFSYSLRLSVVWCHDPGTNPVFHTKTDASPRNLGDANNDRTDYHGIDTIRPCAISRTFTEKSPYWEFLQNGTDGWDLRWECHHPFWNITTGPGCNPVVSHYLSDPQEAVFQRFCKTRKCSKNSLIHGSYRMADIGLQRVHARHPVYIPALRHNRASILWNHKPILWRLAWRWTW